MENKIKRLIVFMFLAILPLSLWSQNSSTQSYYIQDTEEGATFIQTFRWEANDFVQKYIFIIEKQNKKGNWEEIDRQETENNFIEESLSAGEYRYKLQLFNFLGYVELETDWQNVSITKAYQPKISSVSPKIIYLEEEQDGIFTFDGDELSDTTEFEIKSGKNVLPGTIIQSSKRNNSVKYQVNPEDLDTGSYTVTAKNIGGLKDTFKEVKIQFKKPTDIDLAFGLSPVINVGDSTFKNYFSSYFYPFGADIKLTFIPLKKKYGYYGFSIDNKFYYLSTNNNAYEISAEILMTSINFVFQKPFANKKLFLDLHAGIGATTILNMYFQFPHNIVSEELYTMSPNANAGVSLLIYVNKRLYLEAGVDYNLSANIDFKSFNNTILVHNIVPVVNVGWQF